MSTRLGRAAGVVTATVICVALAPSVASAASPHATARAAAPAVAAGDWLGEANYLRSFWSSAVPNLTEDTTLSANDAKHVHYLDETKTCTNSENKKSKYYTAAGDDAGRHSIIYCGTPPGPRDDVDGWVRNAGTGERVLNPLLTATGFADSSQHAAMDTGTNASAGAPITKPLTWPNGAGAPFDSFAGDTSELSSCGSTYTSSTDLGAPLFADLPGAAHSATPAVSLLDSTTHTSVPVCVLTSPDVTSVSAALVPLHRLAGGDSYTGSYTAAGVKATWSFTVAVRPPSTPVEVDLLGSGNHEATLGWTSPIDDGGARVTGYDVEYCKAGTTAWSAPVKAFTHSTATSQTVTGLTNGAAYRFRVAALNAAGAGGFQLSNGTATPAPSAPDAPTAVKGTAGNARITLTWKAPKNDGGKPVTSYIVEESAGGHGYHTLSPEVTGTKLTITGLTNGTAYVFRVAAKSSLGTGPVSDASAPLTPQPARPGHPQLVSARPAKGAATVSWLPPASNGGGKITGYRVQYSTNGTNWTSVTRSGTSTTQKVAGLVDGTSYRFRVAAVNAAGAGSYTTTVTAGSVTPGVTVPGGATVDASLHSTTSHYGSGVRVTCSVAQGKKPASGVPVAVIFRPLGSSAPYVGSAVKQSSKGGRANFSVDPPQDSGVRCMTLGTDQHVAATGPSHRLDVAPAVSLHLSKRTVEHGRTIVITGRVAPAMAGRVVVQSEKKGAWHALGSSISVEDNGSYRTTLTVSGHGQVRLRAHLGATSTTAAANSTSVTLTIT